MDDIAEGSFQPNIVKNGKEPVEFAAVSLKQYADYEIINYDTISSVLEQYYAAKKYLHQNPSKVRRFTKNRHLLH